MALFAGSQGKGQRQVHRGPGDSRLFNPYITVVMKVSSYSGTLSKDTAEVTPGQDPASQSPPHAGGDWTQSRPEVSPLTLDAQNMDICREWDGLNSEVVSEHNLVHDIKAGAHDFSGARQTSSSSTVTDETVRDCLKGTLNVYHIKGHQSRENRSIFQP
jgi:hypothetical protein